jgi:metal-responsive CopG/Arc/MetJ family transcriptional regulator
MRTLIDIPDTQVKELARLSKAEKRSRAAIVRDAIADYLERRSASKEIPGFGLWKDYNIDGVEYQRKIRSEW